MNAALPIGWRSRTAAGNEIRPLSVLEESSRWARIDSGTIESMRALVLQRGASVSRTFDTTAWLVSGMPLGVHPGR